MGRSQSLGQGRSLSLGQSRSLSQDLRITPAPRRNVQLARGVTAALLHEGPSWTVCVSQAHLMYVLFELGLLSAVFLLDRIIRLLRTERELESESEP